MGLALAGLLGYWFWKSEPVAPDACDQALAQTRLALQQENMKQARRHAQTAMSQCRDKERAGLAKTAHGDARSVLRKPIQAQGRAEGQERRPASRSSAQGELLRSFLRDAELSLQQQRYGMAKTYAESAQRIDPRNAEAARLLRRIKEQEMRPMRDRVVVE